MSAGREPVWTGKYIGIPYSDDGRSFAGLFCWGLVDLVYREELGIVLPRYGVAAGTLIACSRVLAGGLLPPWREAIAPYRCFDIVTMRGRARPSSPAREYHVGVMLSARKLMHAEEDIGVHKLDLDCFAVRHRVVRVVRHEALA